MSANGDKYTINMEHFWEDPSEMFIWCGQEGCPEPNLGDGYFTLSFTHVMGLVALHESEYHSD